MTLWTTILSLTTVLASTALRGQADTTEWKDFKSRQLIYYKTTSYNNILIALDSTSTDTLEIDRQISKNRSESIMYENNKPKYKISCKGYYDEKAKQTQKEERHHNFLHFLSSLHIKRHNCFFPVFYYSKSAKITQRQVYENSKWKKCKDENIKPAYAIIENYLVNIDRQGHAKF